MFNNIGAKIKGLAKFLFWVTVIISIIAGLLFIVKGAGNINSSTSAKIQAVIIGAVAVVAGIIIGWLQNILLYGFGELIDTNQKMLKILEDKNEEKNKE